MKVQTFLEILLILSYFGVNGLSNQPGGVNLTPQTDNILPYVCEQNYIFNSQICMACSTITGGICICKASNGCDSVVCNDGYYQVGLTCVAIPDKNCVKGGIAADGTSIICYSCSTGSTLIGGICVTNNNCDTFDLTTGICTKCSNGYYNVMAEFTPNQYSDSAPSTWQQSNYPQYYQNINQCKLCSDLTSNCKTCNYLKQCTACQDGYFLENDVCTLCTANCQVCDTKTTCKNCQPTYNLKSPTECQQCPQYWNSSTNQCGDCSAIDNCSKCTSQNNCTQCSGAFSVLNGSCQSCPNYPNTCSACNAQGVCTDCSSIKPIAKLSSNNLCITCPSNCFSVSNCIIDSQNNATCNKCLDLYYINAQGQCAKCDTAGQSNGLRCSYNGTDVTYTQCKPNYFLLNNQCIQAQTENTCAKLLTQQDGQTPQSDWSKQCAECWPSFLQSGSTCFQCQNCQAGACSLNTSGQTSCTACTNGYYSDTNQVCQICVNNCLQCTGPAIGDCSNCLPGYFKNGSTCSACTSDSSNSTTCLVCQDASNCTTCINGYYNSNGQCLACQYGCSQCIAPGNVCQACITGYYLQNGGCVQDDANCLSTDNNKILSSLQQTQSNGCQICNYGFYLTSGWLTQSASSQIQNNVCMQCVYPQNAFVCRANPVNLSVSPVSTTTVTAPNNALYFSKGAIQPNIQNFSLLTPRYTSPTCNSGYFWTNQSCMPCMSIINGLCTSCSNLNSCSSITCNTNFFLITLNNNQTCAPMPTGCSELNYSTTLLALSCTKCDSGYTLVGNICIAINGCQTINPSNGICTQCQEGFYFNWDFYWSSSALTAPKTNANYYTTFNKFCSACTAGCQICPSLYTCTQCLPGYFWYQSTIIDRSKTTFVTYSSSSNTNYYGQCVKCPKYCQTCSTTNTCSACYPNFTLDPNSTVGDCMCPAGYNLAATGSTPTCTQQGTVTQPCQITACSQCSSDNTQCLTCLPQYLGKSYTLQGSTCVTCSQNCSSCTLMSGSTSQTTCTVCQNGYYMTQSSNDQPVLCTICSQPGALLCQGPLENSTFTQVTVIQCQNNYYLYNGVCVSVPNLPTCYTISSSSSSSCQQCLPGYTLYGNTCQTCATSNNQQCLTCNANGDNSGLLCTSCQPGYIIDTQNNVCVACQTGCLKCTLISATAQNNQKSTQCSGCSDGNYLDNTSGNCFACPFRCKTCDSKYTCTTCQDGYYMKQSQTTINNKQLTFKPCYPCQANCATCTGPNGNVCLTCSTGYVLQSGGCVNLFATSVTLSPPENPNISNTANCYQLDPANGGCQNCLAGFYLDQQKVCQVCVSPYNNFVCGLKAVSPTNPVNPGPGPGPTPGPTPTNTTLQIGTNPVPPNSYSIILGMLIIIVLQ